MTFEGKFVNFSVMIDMTYNMKLEFFRHYNNKEVKKDMSERNYVLMWNLMPQEYDEAVQLIPGLQETPRDLVVKIINFLNEKRGHARQN